MKRKLGPGFAFAPAVKPIWKARQVLPQWTGVGEMFELADIEGEASMVAAELKRELYTLVDENYEDHDEGENLADQIRDDLYAEFTHDETKIEVTASSFTDICYQAFLTYEGKWIFSDDVDEYGMEKLEGYQYE